jgi:hypothetical protein
MDFKNKVSIDYSCVDVTLKSCIELAINTRFDIEAGYVWDGPIERIPDFIAAIAEGYTEYRIIKSKETGSKE